MKIFTKLAAIAVILLSITACGSAYAYDYDTDDWSDPRSGMVN